MLCYVKSSRLAGPALSWFHCLAPNTVTFFHCLSEKFVTQYMRSIRMKQSVTNIFRFRLGRSECIKDFMKRFGAAILQLEAVTPYTILQAVKQAIRLNTQFFDSLSLHPPMTIDELFQRGYQYAMLKDDIVATTKRTVATTSDSR